MTSSKHIKHQLARFVRYHPWIIANLYRAWRMTRITNSIGVVGVIIDDQQRFLLVEHVFHPHTPWGLPGGWVGRDEHPDQALVREFSEELDLCIQVGPVLLAEFDYGKHLDIAYLCVPSGQIGQLSYELLQYQWYAHSSLPEINQFHHRAMQQAIKLIRRFKDTYDNDTSR